MDECSIMGSTWLPQRPVREAVSRLVQTVNIQRNLQNFPVHPPTHKANF